MKAVVIVLGLVIAFIIAAGSIGAAAANVPCTVTYDQAPAHFTPIAGPGSVVCSVQVDLTGAVCITTDHKYHRQDCKSITSEYSYTTPEHAIAGGYKPCKICKP